jgi:hypothetical protein
VDIIQRWTDPRLAYDKKKQSVIFLSGEILDKLWIPDTYINNARRVTVDPSTKSAMLYANGTVVYAYR